MKIKIKKSTLEKQQEILINHLKQAKDYCMVITDKGVACANKETVDIINAILKLIKALKSNRELSKDDIMIVILVLIKQYKFDFDELKGYMQVIPDDIFD